MLNKCEQHIIIVLFSAHMELNLFFFALNTLSLFIAIFSLPFVHICHLNLKSSHMMDSSIYKYNRLAYSSSLSSTKLIEQEE